MLRDLEDIRAKVDARIKEAQLTIANAETEVTQADESLIVRQSIADIVSSLMSYMDPREAIIILSKLHEAPTFMDLVPRLSQSSDTLSKVLTEEAPLFI